MIFSMSQRSTGCTGIYVNNEFDSLECTDLKINNKEYGSTWIEIKKNNKKNIVIGCIEDILNNFNDFFPIS